MTRFSATRRINKSLEDIERRIARLRERIGEAAARSGRSEKDILFIAVSKLHSAGEVDAAAACGITDVAENKVQELCSKQPLVKAQLNWHLIGHLQTNKVRQVIGKTVLIQSVDSLHLAEEIEKRSAAEGITTNILVQVNAAGEEQKSGTAPENAEPLIRSISDSCPHIKIKGLMHIAPFAEDPEDVRKYFRQVRELYEEIGAKDIPSAAFDTLSMGMSGDFEVAIEEGSNAVRIGTAVFGARNYGIK